MSDTTASPLNSAELAAARRFCGYPAFGGGQSGFQSWRFFETYGLLEYRLANLSNDELVVTRNYLAQLAALETGLLGSADNLDTDQAAVWKHNSGETRDRAALYARWRLEFAGFLGLPPGPALDRCSIIRI